MKRREFIALLGAAAASWPLAAGAQTTSGVRKVGVLLSGVESDPDSQTRIAAFHQGFAELGWKEGENVHIEYRWSAGKSELIRQYAEELVALKPDVILANSTPVIAMLKSLTNSIPVVFALATDPVGLGHVNSLSHPGGNFTGFTFIDPALIGKWIGLLREIMPNAARAGLLFDPNTTPFYPGWIREIEDAHQSGTTELVAMPVHADDEMPFAVEGGLMSYGPDTADIFRRSAGYVDRILKGADPADLPVQQPDKFEFVINLKAAKALGLTVPATLLATADEVIE